MKILLLLLLPCIAFGQSLSSAIRYQASIKKTTAAAGAPTPDILWWQMPASGTILTDSSTSSTKHGGTNSSSITFASDTVNGKTVNAMVGDGTHIAATTNTINYATNQWSLSVWVKSAAAWNGADRILFESSANYNGVAGAWICNYDDTAKKLAFGMYGTDYCDGNLGGRNVPTNSWVHVVIEYNGADTVANGSFSVYTNTVAATPITYNNQAMGAPVNASTQILYVMGRSGNNNPFNGRIADLRIYSGLLSTNNITSIYNDPK